MPNVKDWLRDGILEDLELQAEIHPKVPPPFPGPSGTYHIDIVIAAENDGQSEVSLGVGGVKQQSWTYPLSPTQAFTPVTLHGPTIYLDNGVEIRLVGKQNSEAYARIDHIKFIPV